MKKDQNPRWIIWLIHLICFALLLGTGATIYRYSENEYFRSALRRGDYLDSGAFENLVGMDLRNAISYIRLARKLETDGKLDLDKIVLTGVTEEGKHVAYTLQNALDYGRTIGMTFNADNRLVVGETEENSASRESAGSSQVYGEESTRKKGTINEQTAQLSLLYQLDEYYELRQLLFMEQGGGNFKFRLVLSDPGGQVMISTNVDSSMTRENLQAFGRYFAADSTSGTLSSNFTREQIDHLMSVLEDAGIFSEETYEILAGVDTDFPAADKYYEQSEIYRQFVRLLWLLEIMGVLLMAGMLITFLALVLTGRSDVRETDLWFAELVLLGMFLAGMILYWGLTQIRYGFSAHSFLDVLTGTVLCVLMYFPLLFGLMNLIRRIRCGRFLDSFLCVRAARGIREGYENRNDRVKSGTQVLQLLLFLVLAAALSFAAGLFAGDSRSTIGILFLLAVLLLCAWYLARAAQRGRQTKAIFERIDALGRGEVGTKLDTASLHGDIRRMAEAVNALDHSLERAVSERTSSERMKTELIANVSHDLRTPLTSIINYVDLMKRENISNPRVKEYLQVLDAKAMRMKEMAESLLEASRASSGNMKIEMERIDMVQMIRQVYGEFQERMEEKGLFPVLRLVDPPAFILADGKILWRVLDNLYTNVCKYGKPGTQVLIELQETAHSLVYTMKNVSAVPLRYSSEELQERFIRGEDSRTTEGSGLGLSIARSMTEQLGGKFELYSDEEMFRVRLIFPMAAEK